MLRLIIIVPFLAVLGVFLIFNEEPVQMYFPLLSWQVSVGAFALLLGLASFIIGVLVMFVSLVKQWRKVRTANKQIQELEKKLNELREQYINNLTQPVAGHAAIQTPSEPVTVIGQSAEADAETLTLTK
ncbi:lipopolysaccharide assembly protein LapA domain-containing protein [Commensalibacter nepenthis]|uniref:LapA family protein n=1 Tax=Commensalibacter nepenthis TaxID=3043872 RepID=A0ABT6Q7U5_9PROT|nr:LapA family protein [Commensalibacter sp. TBRC 10068]MDI2112954.1 LapA family protein [Commensalibacter sp. TBRC 10068]